MTSPVRDHMLIDPLLQQEITRRIQAAKFSVSQPAQTADPLGTITYPDGTCVAVYLRHAVDAVLLDTAGHVVLITRRHNPGAGLEALPGGFIDPTHDATGAL